MLAKPSKIKTEITFPIEFSVFCTTILTVKHGYWRNHVWFVVKETEKCINYDKYPFKRQSDSYGQIRKAYEKIRCYIKPFAQK